MKGYLYLRISLFLMYVSTSLLSLLSFFKADLQEKEEFFFQNLFVFGTYTPQQGLKYVIIVKRKLFRHDFCTVIT